MRTLTTFSTIALLVAAAALPAGAAWQGETVTRDGALTVLNPETPAEGETTLTPEELWRVGGEDEDVLFGVVAELLHDREGNIYVLDGQICEIQVFSPAGEHLRTLGRQGEGPGEFQNATDMFWGPGGQLAVIQAWPGKIVQIRTDGTPGDGFPLPFREGGGFQAASRGMGLADGEQRQFSYLKAYDAGRREIASFVETSREVRFGGWEFREENWSDFQRRWTAAGDGRVAAALSFDDYRLHVWNADGSLDRVIERPGYGAVERTDGERQRFQTLYDRLTFWNPGSTFTVRGTHQAVGQLHFREDGSLWVQSGRDQWRPARKGALGYDVYDREGRFVSRVSLLCDADPVEDGLFFVGDRVYVVTDLFSAVVASFGGGGDLALDEEPEPVTVIAYRLPAEDLALMGSD
jgi:hypothetical protein